MKHPLIVFGGAGIALMIGAGVWAYFFLFYTPTPRAVPNATATSPFTTVAGEDGFGKQVSSASSTEGEAATPIETGSIKTLTTRQVAGAVAVGNTVRFVEAGTGHMYELSATGVERRISGTTIPQTVAAYWSPAGTRVVVTSLKANIPSTVVGILTTSDKGEQTFEGTPLESGAENIGWSGVGDILNYTIATPTGTRGVVKNMKTGAVGTAFTVPMRDVVVTWNPAPLILTKNARTIEGFAYRANLERVTDSLAALSAAPGEQSTLFSGISNNSLVSWVVTGKKTVATSAGVIAEKCAVGQREAVCAVPADISRIATLYPDEWHRGETSFNDTLVSVDLQTGEVHPIGDIQKALREAADIKSIVASNGTYLGLTTEGTLLRISL